MRKTNKLMAAFIATVLMLSNATAQAPQKMSYQSVIRNASGALVANQAVGVKTSVLQGTATGTAVYVETQSPTTNANGLASFQIGGGTVVSGSFASINWAAGPYFVKTETDPTGSTNYSIAGTTQLLSVAYALYAANSGTPGPTGATGTQGIQGVKGDKGDTGNTGAQGIQGAKGDSGVSIRTTAVTGDSLYITLSTGKVLNAGNVRGLTGAIGGYPVHYIGESYGGGIVFFVYDGGQHGLIAATNNYGNLDSISLVHNGYAIYLKEKGNGLLAGILNTTSFSGYTNNNSMESKLLIAANQYTAISNGIVIGNWYLPSLYELDLMYQQKNVIGGFNTTYPYPSSSGYGYLPIIKFMDFSNGDETFLNNNTGAEKYFKFYIRLIRAF